MGEKVENFLEKYIEEIEYDSLNDWCIPDLKEFSKTKTMYDYQEKACEAVINAKNGVMVLPAGSGKTQVALEIIARLGYKALWIASTIDLINQSYNRARDNFTNIGIGKIVSGKIEIGTHITFATVQTLSKIDLQEYANEFDIIVVDECHRICRYTLCYGNVL